MNEFAPPELLEQTRRLFRIRSLENPVSSRAHVDTIALITRAIIVSVATVLRQAPDNFTLSRTMKPNNQIPCRKSHHCHRLTLPEQGRRPHLDRARDPAGPDVVTNPTWTKPRVTVDSSPSAQFGIIAQVTPATNTN